MAAESIHEPLPVTPVEEHLGHGEVRAGFDLAEEALDLEVEVVVGRVDRDADPEVGRGADRVAVAVDAAVELRDVLHHADRIGLVDIVSAGFAGDDRWVARDDEHVADPDGPGAEQVAFDAHLGRVARRVVRHRFKADALDHRRHPERVHVQACHGVGVDVDDIDEPGFAESLARIEDHLWVGALGRIDLHRHHELARVEHGPEAAGDAFDRRDVAGCLRGWCDDADRFFLGRPALDGFGHGLDMRRGRTAATAHDPRTAFDRLPREPGEVFRRAVGVDEPSRFDAWQARVGLNGEPRAVQGRCHERHRVEHLAGAERAVRANGHAPERIEPLEGLGGPTRQHFLLTGPIVDRGERDLRDDGQIGHRSHGAHGLFKLPGPGKGLEDEEIHAAFIERDGLLAEDLEELIALLVRPLQTHPGGPDGAGDKDVGARDFTRLAGQLHGLGVDLDGAVLQPEARELGAVGAEAIGFDDAGARLDEAQVDAEHLRAVGQAELVDAPDRPFDDLVAHRAHAPVSDEYTGVERVDKTSHARPPTRLIPALAIAGNLQRGGGRTDPRTSAVNSAIGRAVKPGGQARGSRRSRRGHPRSVPQRAIER